MTDRPEKPHAHNLRDGRWSEGFTTYFITKCTYQRRPFLKDATAAEAVIDALAYQRQIGTIKLLGFVVMPDHYHTIFCLLDPRSISQVMHDVGSFTANNIRKHFQLSSPIWQPDGYFDHRCRPREDVEDLINYMHHNPVRKGWVANASDWLYSSAHPNHRGLLDFDWWFDRDPRKE